MTPIQAEWLNDRNVRETVNSGCSHYGPLTLRCRPPPGTSNFNFLHLAVIEEDRAYDSNGSEVIRRGRRKLSLDRSPR